MLTTVAGQLQALAVLLLSAALGAAIGLEREWARKPAGLRTHIFIAVASTLFTLFGFALLKSFDGAGLVRGDPVRIMQAIVVGISFLGAGTIIHAQRDRIEGLTTAASILLVAGIGMAVGVGLYVLAVGVTVITVLVLVMLHPFELWLKNRNGKETQSDDE